jgi:uncharacterized lipoprotein YddW (UPF0748 family)
MIKTIVFICGVIAASFLFLVPGLAATSKAGDMVPPRPLREFRGAWVTTRANVDWPSKPGLSTAQQQAELVRIMDQAVRLNLNALILQVRPVCDAFYPSRFEPWSEYLTGVMGRAPEPYYDPLAFAVEQAHQRGLELHAWFNPYRARYSSAKSSVATNHISRTQPKLVRVYGDYLWLDPAEKAVQEHTRSVIMDVVRRYDIDGVHLDDYFYPYKATNAAGKLVDFPDESTWKQYQAGGGKLSRNDWRRKNVDDLVQSLYQNIKAEKPRVKFGLSPFGIWRPGHPKGITGLDAYDQIYADARKWLTNGWADYFAPQLYWRIRPPEHSYSALLSWWASQNTQNRHLWPGNNSAQVGKEWKADEIVNQIRLTRQQPGATGNIHWHVSSLSRNPGGLGDVLAKGVYAQPALVPAVPWLDNQPPGQPVLSIREEQHSKTLQKTLRLSWEATGSEPVWLWILQTRTGNQWKTEIVPSKVVSRSLAQRGSNRWPDLIAITAVDRCGNVGSVVVKETKKATR